MKTLKKTLCVILAVVMVLGVLVIPAGAAGFDDYTDKADITHPTAAKVLSALGIIQGKDDGTYAPKDILTRAEGAKILVTAVLGENAKYLSNNVAPFSDVPAGNWAAGYIAYAASAGIIDGDGSGKFNPTDTLTGHQLAKLLLVAMGVDGNYTGANWQIDVALNAGKYHLLDDLSDLSLADPINRDDAIQMTFNGLMASVSGSTEVTYRITLNGRTFDVKDQTTAMLYILQGAECQVLDEATDTLGNAVYGLRRGTDIGDFCRPNVKYYAGNDVIVEIGNEPAKVYTGSIEASKIGSDMGIGSVNKEYTLNVYEDGIFNKTATYTRATTKEAFGGNGATVEVYNKGNNIFDVIVINTYAKKLVKSDIKAAQKADATHDARDAYIVLERDGDNETVTFTTSEFKADNVVLYTKSGTKAVSVVLAESVTGQIDRYNSGKNVTVGGTTYNFAANKLDETKYPIIPTAGTDVVFGRDYVFYTDTNKNVYGRENVETSNQSRLDGYVWLFQYQIKANGTTGDLFNASVATSYEIKAQVLEQDGTNKVVDVAVTKDKNDFKWNRPAGMGECAVEENHVIAAGEAGLYNTGIGGWVGYTVDENGVYTFHDIDAIAAVGTVNKADKTSNVRIGSRTARMTSSSTYNEFNVKTNKLTTSVGYQNITVDNGVNALVVYTNAAKSVVKDVYRIVDYTPETHTDLDYAFYVGSGANVSGGVEVNFFVGGNAVTYAKATVNDLTKGEVYKIRVDDKGIVTTSAYVDDAVRGVVTFIDEGYYLVDTEGTETLDDDATVILAGGTVVYNATSDGAGATDTVELGDTIQVYTKTTGDINTEAVVIFITANAE